MERFLDSNVDFKYQLLGRMVSDCEYFLGLGNRCEKYLWSKNVDNHIADMRLLYNSLSENEKPDSLSLEDIDRYEVLMKEKRSSH